MKEVAQRLGVSPGVVYYWIDKGLIQGRRHNAGSPYLLAMTPAVERELVDVSPSRHASNRSNSGAFIHPHAQSQLQEVQYATTVASLEDKIVQ